MNIPTSLRLGSFLLLLASLLLLSACSSSGSRSGSGGYYSTDGPPSNVPKNLDAIPDAVPRNEALARGPNKPYTVMGQNFVPDTSGQPYKKQGRASWYGKKFHGNKTSNGESYDMFAMTAAHPTLPIPSYVRVTRVSNGKSVVLRVNDRGPFLHGRVIDLSYVAAYKLGMLGPGSTEVIVERVTPDDMKQAPIRPMVADIPAPVTAPQVLLPPVAATSVATSSARSPAPQSPTTPGAVYLQIGAFTQPSNAQQLLEQASQRIPSPLNQSLHIDEQAGPIYRVRIGPFANRQIALDSVEPIQQSTGLAPSISVR
jgi:rare lipoprotein A